LRVPWPLALALPALWALLIWDLSSHRVPLPTHENKFWELLSNLAHAPLFGTLTLLWRRSPCASATAPGRGCGARASRW
jgi:hypothetical protein